MTFPIGGAGATTRNMDLSLRVLKDGWCKVLFLAFLARKIQTMTLKGGNTHELYAGDGRLKLAQPLRDQHSDVARATWKWGRWQHQVDYRPFKKNQLILKPGVVIPKMVNNFGMALREKQFLEK